MRVLLLCLVFVLVLFGDHDEYDEHRYEKYHLPLDVSYLDLDSQQYKQIKHIVKRFKHQHKEFHEKKEKSRKKISRLFLSEDFDKEEFIRLSNTLKSISVEIQANFFVEIHKILNKKQKKRFIRYMQEWEVE